MSDQLTLDDEHAYIARKAPATSREAAQNALPSSGTQRRSVYDFILQRGEYGATDEEIKNALPINPNSEIPRRLELKEQGLIYDSGRTRLTKSGSSAIIWLATLPQDVPEATNPSPPTSSERKKEKRGSAVGNNERTASGAHLRKAIIREWKSDDEVIYRPFYCPAKMWVVETPAGCCLGPHYELFYNERNPK